MKRREVLICIAILLISLLSGYRNEPMNLLSILIREGFSIDSLIGIMRLTVLICTIGVIIWLSLRDINTKIIVDLKLLFFSITKWIIIGVLILSIIELINSVISGFLFDLMGNVSFSIYILSSFWRVIIIVAIYHFIIKDFYTKNNMDITSFRHMLFKEQLVVPVTLASIGIFIGLLVDLFGVIHSAKTMNSLWEVFSSGPYEPVILIKAAKFFLYCTSIIYVIIAWKRRLSYLLYHSIQSN